MVFRQAIFAVVSVLAVLAYQVSDAEAQVFEVIHPEVEKGGWEVEALNGVVLDDVEDDEEKSVHEFAVGFGFTEFWKSTIAVEVANPEGADPIVEAFEWENVLLLTSAFGHHDEEGDGHGHGDFSFGIYTALEIPKEVGIKEGAVAVGPIFEAALGPVNFIGNFFVEVPFEDGVDAGIAYAAQASIPVSEHLAVGLEAHGDVEEAFGDPPPFDEQAHFIGPAVFFETEVGGLVLEPRVAVLFGLTDESPDAVLSFNLELKFGGAGPHH